MCKNIYIVLILVQFLLLHGVNSTEVLAQRNEAKQSHLSTNSVDNIGLQNLVLSRKAASTFVHPSRRRLGWFKEKALAALGTVGDVLGLHGSEVARNFGPDEMYYSTGKQYFGASSAEYYEDNGLPDRDFRIRVFREGILRCNSRYFRQTDAFGMMNCFHCPVGKYKKETGKNKCKSCDLGQYQNEKAKAECKRCYVGSYQNQNAQPSCKSCTKGMFSSIYNYSTSSNLNKLTLLFFSFSII